MERGWSLFDRGRRDRKSLKNGPFPSQANVSKTFGEISEKVARSAVEQGFNTKATVEELHKPDIDTVLPHGSVIFGTNARSKAQRATEYLGWTPREESLEANIPSTVVIEAQRRQN